MTTTETTTRSMDLSALETTDRLEHVWTTNDSGRWWANCLRLDWGDREAEVEARLHGDNSIPCYDYHGHRSRYELPQNVDAVALLEWLRSDEIAGLLDRVCAGYEADYNARGNNVATFDEDAQDAKAALDLAWERACDYNTGCLCLADGEGMFDATEWLYETYSPDAEPRRVDPTSECELRHLDAAGLQALATQLEADARADNIVLDDCLAALERFQLERFQEGQRERWGCETQEKLGLADEVQALREG